MSFRSAVTGIQNGMRGGVGLLLSILGLSLGLAVCFLILTVVRYETGFDSFVTDADDIYRVEVTMSAPGRDPITASSVMGRMRDALVADFPDIAESNRFVSDSIVLRRGDDLFEQAVYEAETNFASFFGLTFRAGNVGNPDDMSSALISASLAHRLFGRESVIGEALSSTDGRDFIVTGVFDDWPENSHMRPELVIPFNLGRYADSRGYQSWLAPFIYTYFKLQTPADALAVSTGLEDFLDRRVDLSDRPGFADLRPSELLDLNLIAIEDIHLKSQAASDLSAHGDGDGIFSLLVVAALVLVVAIINFSLLFTAVALKRTRSTAMHLAVGASRKDVALMFLLGPMVPVSVAMAAAGGLTFLALPYLSATGLVNVAVDVGPMVAVLPVLASLWLVSTLGGGMISAIVMSLLKPAEVLQTSHARSTPIRRVQSILVFLQFAIVIGLMAITIGIFRQNQYTAGYDPGYRAEGLSVLSFVPEEILETTTDELSKIPGVSSVTWSSHVPGDENASFVTIRQTDGPDGDAQTINMIAVGPRFFETLGIEISAGREFSAQRSGEAVGAGPENGDVPSGAIILNQAAARLFGNIDPAAAIGQSLLVSRNSLPETNVTVIGVVADFHLETLHRPVTPTIYLNWPAFFAVPVVKADGLDAAGLESAIRPIWQRLQKDQILSVRSLPGSLAASYAADRQLAGLFGGLVLLSIVLASLGLYGVAALGTAARTREIGIRKVLGASAAQIVVLLTYQISRPVLLANLLAWPLGWYFVDQWLVQFAYRVEASVLWLAGATFVTLIVAGGTVIGHATRAARTNPVRSLRYQ